VFFLIFIGHCGRARGLPRSPEMAIYAALIGLDTARRGAFLATLRRFGGNSQ
jgi:hypothetical protein